MKNNYFLTFAFSALMTLCGCSNNNRKVEPTPTPTDDPVVIPSPTVTPSPVINENLGLPVDTKASFSNGEEIGKITANDETDFVITQDIAAQSRQALLTLLDLARTGTADSQNRRNGTMNIVCAENLRAF